MGAWEGLRWLEWMHSGNTFIVFACMLGFWIRRDACSMIFPPFFICVCKGRDLVIWSGYIGWHGVALGSFAFLFGGAMINIYYFVEGMAYCSFLRKCNRL